MSGAGYEDEVAALEAKLDEALDRRRRRQLSRECPVVPPCPPSPLPRARWAEGRLTREQLPSSKRLLPMTSAHTHAHTRT